MKNYENFAAALGWIEEDPSKHDQTNWCGTKCCLAGFGAAMALGTTDRSPDLMRRLLNADYWSGEYAVYDKAAEWFGIGKYADDEMTYWLFSSRRTLDDFRRVRLVAGWANFPA